MNRHFISRIAVCLRTALFACLMGAALSNIAAADERHERHEGARGHEIYRSPHWVLDERHHHSHYYPAVGYVIATPPPTAITVGFRGRQLFVSAGVWYEMAQAGYIVVRPPLGVVVPILPPGYSTVYVGSVPYYYANDTYYVAGPGGYAVTAAPTTYVEQSQAPTANGAAFPPPSQGLATAAPAAVASAGEWYWCAASNAYYPYVQTCAAGWTKVPAHPPGTP